MKYAVIGTGFIFRKHLQAINQTGGKIVDVCDITHGRGKEWKNIVKNSEADAAVILAPNYLHYEIAKAANAAGKIVLCEKPLALKSEHVKALMARKNIFVVQQLRYHPEVKRLEKQIDKNKNTIFQLMFPCFAIGIILTAGKGTLKNPAGRYSRWACIILNCCCTCSVRRLRRR